MLNVKIWYKSNTSKEESLSQLSDSAKGGFVAAGRYWPGQTRQSKADAAELTSWAKWFSPQLIPMKIPQFSQAPS